MTDLNADGAHIAFHLRRNGGELEPLLNEFPVVELLKMNRDLSDVHVLGSRTFIE